MQCNIDARGRLVRLIGGVGALLAAAILLLLIKLGYVEGLVPLTAALMCLVFGIIGVVQGWAGICVVRAMGFKTRV